MNVDFLLKYVDFTEEELTIISTKFYQKTFLKNEFFIEEGEICDKIAFIENGSLILSQTLETGNEMILDFFTSGNLISDYYSFLKNQITDTHIKALSNVTLLVINKKDIHQLFDSIPNFQKLGRLLAEKYFIELAEHLKSTGLSHIERYERLIHKRPRIFDEFPQYMIASYLRISPEWLSKIRAQK